MMYRTVLTGGLLFFLSASATAGEGLAINSKSELCRGCHGLNGNSTNPSRPILAGQNEEYLIEQLKAFQSGKRANDEMAVVSQSLAPGEIPEIAAFFSGQTPISPGGDLRLAEQGKATYSMCAGCHGADAKGGDGYPRLAGQHPEYLVRQLENFKRGIRGNPVMRQITLSLSSEDISAIGAYLGSLNLEKRAAGEPGNGRIASSRTDQSVPAVE
ncbi:MAG: c-type cytochrome [Gammaproteobacteria bacterium]